MPQDPKYRPQDERTAIANVVQNCGEVLHAIGKIGRWGNESVNPLVPRSQQETNRRLALRKFAELRAAMTHAEEYLAAPDVAVAIFDLDDFLKYVRKLHAKEGLGGLRDVLVESGYLHMTALVQAGPTAWSQFCENAAKALGEKSPFAKAPAPKKVRDGDDDDDDFI